MVGGAVLEPPKKGRFGGVPDPKVYFTGRVGIYRGTTADHKKRDSFGFGRAIFAVLVRSFMRFWWGPITGNFEMPFW